MNKLLNFLKLVSLIYQGVNNLKVEKGGVSLNLKLFNNETSISIVQDQLSLKFNNLRISLDKSKVEIKVFKDTQINIVPAGDVSIKTTGSLSLDGYPLYLNSDKSNNDQQSLEAVVNNLGRLQKQFTNQEIQGVK